MKCQECLLDDVQYDELSNTCYCPNCRKMWTPKKIVEHDVIFPIGVLLTILMFIPIVNVILIVILPKLHIKEQYYKSIVCVFVAWLVLLLSFMFMVLYKGYSLQDVITYNVNSYIDGIIVDVVTQQKINQGIDEEIKYRQQLIELQKAEEQKKKELDAFSKVMQSGEGMTNIDRIIMYLDGSQITGEKVLSLIDELKSDKTTVLLQTNALRNKYGEYYKVYGIKPDCCIDLMDTGNICLDVTRKTSFYNFNYNPVIVGGATEEILYDDFSTKNTIWRIKSDSYFICMFRVVDGYRLLGFKEVDKED